MVFIGLISYSLYLWHWPLIVFHRTDGLLVADASNTTTELVLIVVSIGIACLSWKFVELPFRSKAKDTSKATVFGVASTAMISGLCALRPGADRKRGAVSLSGAGGGDRRLSRI